MTEFEINSNSYDDPLDLMWSSETTRNLAIVLFSEIKINPQGPTDNLSVLIKLINKKDENDSIAELLKNVDIKDITMSTRIVGYILNETYVETEPDSQDVYKSFETSILGKEDIRALLHYYGDKLTNQERGAFEERLKCYEQFDQLKKGV
ncbi:hypothetical protein [Methanolobus sp.]|jgi:NurA-like 5'-3' nuclease|uniref:hypothetical protein n=1 Tax=Methanolobus sp. TaxID=1874737 RepID=UPI0025F00118|nr:hypothetical protein [Methanolobus sp.]